MSTINLRLPLEKKFLIEKRSWKEYKWHFTIFFTKKLIYLIIKINYVINNEDFFQFTYLKLKIIVRKFFL